MTGEWTFVVHQQAFEIFESLRGADRREVRAAFARLRAHPLQTPDRELRPANDRIYATLRAGRFEIIYWLDIIVKQVCITRLERLR